MLNESSKTIVDQISIGESLNLSYEAIGNMKYYGSCPTGIANNIKMLKTVDG